MRGLRVCAGLTTAALLCSAGHALAQDGNVVAVPITVTEVVTTSVAPQIPAAGTVFSQNQTQITAGIAGRLEWVAEPGDVIAEGEPVARFDCEMLELSRGRPLGNQLQDAGPRGHPARIAARNQRRVGDSARAYPGRPRSGRQRPAYCAYRDS